MSNNAEKYIRDKRSPKPKNETVSRVMSANKAKNTKPEITFRKELSKNGIRGYRLHYAKIPGRPDLCFVSKKLAIFINGCYWHRCPTCDLPLPKNNTLFWQTKFDKNVQRDSVKIKQLQELGWRVITVWECEIKKNVKKIINDVQKALKLE